MHMIKAKVGITLIAQENRTLSVILRNQVIKEGYKVTSL